jgi:hypothetical protein
MFNSFLRRQLLPATVLFISLPSVAQTAYNPRYNNSSVYTGIEVGSKGVKMSVIELGKNGSSNGTFKILKDSSVNTDFISFSEPTFSATLKGLCGLYESAIKDYQIPPKRIFTVISSGVKMQAEKDSKTTWISNLIDSFKLKINEPSRQVEVVDVEQEARLSHLGIVPDSRRYNTFLIDIGSGNTKGGYFPFDNTETFRLYQLNWGTKSTANAVEKRCQGDNSLDNFNKEMYRVLSTVENSDIVYTVNASGAYNYNDNVAISGGIAWAVATLLYPELVDNTIVTVSYGEVAKFCNKLYQNFDALSPAFLSGNIAIPSQKKAVFDETARVQKVFDQKSLMAGAGLLLKIMRQFTSAYETKQFYLIKNGQVGWISAYVDKTVSQ